MNLLYSIPHFNNASKLLRCLESIVKYKDHDSKILIIDDCSSENELKIIFNSTLFNDSYTKKNIFFERNLVNNGPAYCRNKCIDFANLNSIEYITFIDADDYLINKIETISLDNNDIVFYDSAEVLENDKINDIDKIQILKYNKFKFSTLEEEILDYAIRPNQITSLTTCWSKIFNTKKITNNKIKFNERMRTFEDVDFLIKYLNIVNKYMVVPTVAYHHTNNLNYDSATFGHNKNFNSLFGFLQVCRKLKIYFKTRNVQFNKHHFISCYFSITIIRIAFKNHRLNDLQRCYKFIKKRINSKMMQMAFNNYDVNIAKGRPLIKVLIKHRYALLLTIYVTIIGKNRYRKRG